VIFTSDNGGFCNATSDATPQAIQGARKLRVFIGEWQCVASLQENHQTLGTK